MRAVEIGRTHEPAHRHAPPRFACFSIGPDGRGHHGEFGHFPPTSEHSPPRPTLRRYSGRSACASSSCQATRPRATRPSWLAAWSRFSGVGDNNVLSLLKIVETSRKPQFPRAVPISSGRMVTILFALVSFLSFRFRSRASLELELVALRHQVIVLRRQRPQRLRLLSADRLLWVWLYRVRPQVLETLVLVKPATVVKWHRKGFRIYWRWRSRCPGRTLIYPR